MQSADVLPNPVARSSTLRCMLMDTGLSNNIEKESAALWTCTVGKTLPCESLYLDKTFPCESL